ncbi:MAG: hypothetical protein HY273_03765 [Gammaproteobacteria bacterium]|nr:hypothetical protein [Gammaproteobacteria bacterium]
MSRKKRPDLLVVLAVLVGFGLIATALSLEWLSTDRSKLATRDQLRKDAQEPSIDRRIID